MKKGLLCTVLCAAAISGLAASACFPQLSAQAKGSVAENGMHAIDWDNYKDPIIYELGDPNFPAYSCDGNVVFDDLNMSAEEEDDDFYYGEPIIYELGDDRMPAIDWDNVDDVDILEETVARGDYSPQDFYNLAVEDYYYSFSNVRNYVYTNYYFSTNANGYISISTSGIDNPVYIAMIERDSGQVVSSWQGDPSTILGLGFRGKSTKTYYFIFEPYGVSSVSGSGNIFWDN